MPSPALPPHRHVLRCALLCPSGGVDDAEGNAMAQAFAQAVNGVWGGTAHVGSAERVSAFAVEAVAVSNEEWDPATQRRMLEHTLAAFSQQDLAFGRASAHTTMTRWIYSQKRPDGTVYQGTTVDLHGGEVGPNDVRLQVRSVTAEHIYNDPQDNRRLREVMNAARVALMLRTAPELSAPARGSRQGMRL